MNLIQKAIQFFQTDTNRKINWNEFFGFDKDNPTANFQNFINDGYSRTPDLKPVVDKIASTTSAVKWAVYEERNGELIKDESSKMWDLLYSPNPNQTWNELQYALVVNLALTGNALARGIDSVGLGVEGAFRELEVLYTQGITPNLDANYNIISYDYVIDRIDTTYSAEEIIHMKYFNPTEKGLMTGMGLSPLQSAVYPYKTSLNQWEASSNLLKNKGAIVFISNESDDVLDDQELASAQSAFDKMVGGPKQFGKVRVTPSKMRYNPMGMTAADMQIIEMGVKTLRAICNVYGIDSSLFNDPANKTFNNRKEAEKALWTNVNIPILRMMEAAYNRSFVEKYSQEEGRNLCLKYDVSDVEVLHEDKDKKVDRVIKLLESGVITIEQAQEMIDITD